MVTTPFGERLLNWLFLRKKTVRDGGLFHELDRRRVADEAIVEVADKMRARSKGYRDG